MSSPVIAARWHGRRNTLVRSIAFKAALLVATTAHLCIAAPLASGATAAPDVHIGFLGKAYRSPRPLSILEPRQEIQGLPGARIAVEENNRTGQFLGQRYVLDEFTVAADGDVKTAAREALMKTPILITDLEASDLLAVADLPEARNAVVLDARTSDDILRQSNCRRNVFHVLPNWAMRADALGQFLVRKHWQRWFLLQGSTAADAAYAADVVRSAELFGAKVVARRTFTYDAGSRRTDTGYQQVQKQMPLTTQEAGDYDVLVVIDTADTFGDYLPYNTFDPRPVVGTHGLMPVAWHPAFEDYAASQMQVRFERLAHRSMTERDYGAWLAVRTIGEAVLRSRATQPDKMAEALRSASFKVAGFKGQPMNFRPWDQQLRQPILLAWARMLVSISPQEGFLHPDQLTDTLGFDAGETLCKGLQ